MSTKPAFNVLVIGAGPVGLAAATALAKDGHSVTVLEGRSGLQQIGGGIMVASNGVKAIRYMGMESELKSSSWIIKSLAYTSYKSPEILANYPIDATEMNYGAWRYDLQKMAFETAVEAGAEVVFDKKVVRWDGAAASPAVWTSDGSEYQADLIVASDGVKSTLRRSMHPNETVAASATTQVVFIAVIPHDRLSDARFAPYLNKTECVFVMGPRVYIMTGNTSRGLWMGIFTMDSKLAASPEAINGSWNISADPRQVQEVVRDFDDAPRDLVAKATEWEQWHIGVAPSVDSWSDATGRTILVGDAAHSFPPHAGQGLVQGMEDAAALALLLRHARSERKAADIPQLVGLFESLRRPRVTKIGKLAWEMGTRQSFSDGPEQDARDAKYRQLNAALSGIDWDKVEADGNAPTISPQFLKWVRHYDIGEAVEEAVANHNWVL